MTKEGLKRKLTAVFSADVAGFSRLMCRDEGATVMTLCEYRETMTGLIERHHGRVVDSPGDNLLAEFASVVDAVEAAVAIQKELGSRNAGLPADRKMQFRIGINLGDVIEQDGRLYGTGVNAARLEAMADPGGICVSRAALEHVQDLLPLGYEYLGKYTVKALAHNPESLWAHLGLAAAYSLSGRDKEANEAAARVLSANPLFSLEHLDRISPYRNQKDKDRFIGALRKAGLT